MLSSVRNWKIEIIKKSDLLQKSENVLLHSTIVLLKVHIYSLGSKYVRTEYPLDDTQ